MKALEMYQPCTKCGECMRMQNENDKICFWCLHDQWRICKYCKIKFAAPRKDLEVCIQCGWYENQGYHFDGEQWD